MSKRLYLIPVTAVIVAVVLGFTLGHSSPTSKVQQLKLASASSSAPKNKPASVADTTKLPTVSTSASKSIATASVASSVAGASISDNTGNASVGNTTNTKQVYNGGSTTTTLTVPVSYSTPNPAPTIVSTLYCWVVTPDAFSNGSSGYGNYFVDYYSNHTSTVRGPADYYGAAGSSLTVGNTGYGGNSFDIIPGWYNGDPFDPIDGTPQCPNNQPPIAY